MDAPASRFRVPSWAVLAICCAAQFMVVLDVAIVNVALPQMRQDLGLSVTGQQWVVNAYTLTFAGFLLLGGRAADLFGRRRVFMLGLAAFTLFSLLGGLAQNGAWLIAARAAQGLGGAVLAPATLSIIVTAYHDPQARRRALGAWSATAASGAAVGVLAGGVLTSLLNWRWVLFVNVPIGVVLLASAWVALERDHEQAQAQRRSLDLTGAVLVTAGLAVVVYGIVSTDTHPWGSTSTVVTLAVGVLLLVAFFVTEARFATDPLVPLGFLARRSLAAANGIAVTVGASLFGFFFFLSLYLQQVNGYSPLKAGLAFLPSSLATLTGSLTGTRLVQRLGPRRQLVIGPLIAAAGLVWMTRTYAGAPYLTHILGPVVLFGLGLGMSFVPMTLAGTAGVAPHEAGLASGLINTTRQMGGALGLAIMATVATSAAKTALGRGVATAAALTTGYRWAFGLGAIVLVAGAGLALFLPGLPEHVPHVVEDGEEIAGPVVVVEA